MDADTPSPIPSRANNEEKVSLGGPLCADGEDECVGSVMSVDSTSSTKAGLCVSMPSRHLFPDDPVDGYGGEVSLSAESGALSSALVAAPLSKSQVHIGFTDASTDAHGGAGEVPPTGH